MGNMATEPVPGTGETPPVAPEPSAETQNTDTAQARPPETIPYSRFKEVNDRLSELRGYEELAQYGYDPDSLGRLVTFEANYIEDPVGVTAHLVETLDLPEDRKAAVKLLLQGAPDPAAAQDTTSTDDKLPDTPPKWAEPLIADFVGRHQSAEEAARDQALQAIVGHWDTMDKEAGIETPMETKLTFIAANAVRGGTPEQVAQIARDAALGYREHVLQGAVSEVRNPSGSPLSVPSSGAAPSPGVKITDLKQASALALEALKNGQLPS